MLIPHSYPYLTESDRLAVLECLDMDYVGFDSELDLQIKIKLSEYLSYKYIEITPSASLALMLILKYLSLKEKDEIILSAINCWSVYNVIKLEHLIPVICDVRDKKDFRASYETIKKSITNKTKVIIITHMYGVLVEENIIKHLKKEYPNIIIIEDFSTSIFSKKNYKLGRYSDYAIGSFGSTKPLTAGVGGVMCSHKEIIKLEYDQNHKNHNSFNIKISRMNQSLLLSQLRLYSKYQLIKKQIVDFYNKFVDIYCYNKEFDLFRAITFDTPELLVDYLSSQNIILDIRKSVQPNLAKELAKKNESNAYNFRQYYSLPLNIKMYESLKSKGLIEYE